MRHSPLKPIPSYLNGWIASLQIEMIMMRGDRIHFADLVLMIFTKTQNACYIHNYYCYKIWDYLVKYAIQNLFLTFRIMYKTSAVPSFAKKSILPWSGPLIITYIYLSQQVQVQQRTQCITHLTVQSLRHSQWGCRRSLLSSSQQWGTHARSPPCTRLHGPPMPSDVAPEVTALSAPDEQGVIWVNILLWS